MKQDPSLPSWKFRRRAVFGSLIFAALVIVYVSIKWDDTGLAETLSLGAFGLIGAIVAAYIGGAAYQDVRLYRPISFQDKKYNVEITEDFVEDAIAPEEDI